MKEFLDASNLGDFEELDKWGGVQIYDGGIYKSDEAFKNGTIVFKNFAEKL